MRKQDLVYLHGLLAEVRRYLAARGDLPAGAFDAYEELDVAPPAVHETKAEHQEAVLRLLEGLTTALEARRSTGADARDLSTRA